MELLLIIQSYIMFCFPFTDGIPAFFDTWLLGDKSLIRIYNNFLDTKQRAERDKKNFKLPYLLEFYNVKLIQKSDDVSNNLAISRTLNAFIDTLNKNQRLSKYLIVIMDRDILDDLDVMDEKVHSIIPLIVN